MVSVCIPFRNDFDDILPVIQHLRTTMPAKDTEIIIYNDGSVMGSGQFRPLQIDGTKVINAPRSFGVGYAIDRAVEQACGDIVVIMGSDIYPLAGWYDKVVEAVNSTPETLGCAVCVGLNPSRMSLDDPDNFRRYGADLLFYVDENDLPPQSSLRNRKGGYTSLFKAKWLMSKQSDLPYEIPCLLGAFYFTSKAYYQRLRGFDTEVGNMFMGHRVWGHLEPTLSLKSWLHGGGCTLYPDIEAGHVFARVVRRNRWSKGARSMEWDWWNALWILETMILSPFLKNRLEDFVHPELNFNRARVMINKNRKAVELVRERNRQEFKYDHNIFKDKFNYDFTI